MASPLKSTFTKIIPQIIPTEIIDVYDVIFNVQLPLVPTIPTVENKYNDWYCNDKLSIELMYKAVVDKKKENVSYFSTTSGEGQQTTCILTSPTDESRVAAEYGVIESADTSKPILDTIKQRGIYFTAYDTLNSKITSTFSETYEKLRVIIEPIQKFKTEITIIVAKVDIYQKAYTYTKENAPFKMTIEALQ